MAIDPKVQGGLEKTERERNYRNSKEKLVRLKKQRSRKILTSLGTGAVSAFIPPACIALASVATGATPVMAISPLLAGAGFGTAVATAGIVATVLTDGKEITKLKREVLKYDPEERKLADEELEKEITKDPEYKRIKEENDKFLANKHDSIKTNIEQRKINSLNQPKEKFDPNEKTTENKLGNNETEVLNMFNQMTSSKKFLEEQKREAEEMREKLLEEERKKALMDVLKAGPTDENMNNNREGKSR